MAYKTQTVNEEAITNRLIAVMETGVAPWVCEWNDPRSRFLPFNAVTMKDDPNQTFRGINALNLWVEQHVHGYSCNAWISMKDIKALGGKLITLPEDHPKRANNKTGQSPVPIIFAGPMLKPGFKEVQTGVYRDERTGEINYGEKAFYRLPKVVSRVFNLQQVENLPEEVTGPQAKPQARRNDIETMLKNMEITEVVSQDNRCYYIPSKDEIHIVDLPYFVSDDAWYRTRFHEYTHATGHAIRLDRLVEKPSKEEYAFEELVAELGSAFMCARFGIPGEVQHAGYLESYIKVLKNDPNAIFRAASKAREAFDLIVFHYPENQTAAEAA